MSRRVAKHSDLIAMVSLLVCIVLGCDGNGSMTSHSRGERTPNVSMNDKMRQAVRLGDWAAAWNYSGDALIESNSDPATLELVAQVAFNTDRKSVAADLLVEAARFDQLENPIRFQQAFTGLLAAGRLFDGLDLLREGVNTKPDDDERCRLLVDLLLATEQHLEASRYREILIRKRSFDQELLFAAYRYEVRLEETDSLAKILENNPDDKRPLVGSAKLLSDQRKYESAIGLLRDIAKAHPEFIAGQVLLGRALVQSGQFAALSTWAVGLTEKIDDDPDFWLTLGDWAQHRHENRLALSAYGQAAKRGLDRVEPWHKLAMLFSTQLNTSVDFELIKSRAKSLASLRQGYAELRARSMQSASAIEQITRALVELGRIWEAEAWVAYGTTLPSPSKLEKQSLEELRSQVLAQLRSDTPSQLAKSLPSWSWLETIPPKAMIATLSRDTDIALPNTLAESKSSTSRASLTGPPVRLSLGDEAVQRGLVFFGRTAADLAQPSIFNYQMIGCGGGVIDFDQDGWPDLYLIAAGGTPPNADSSPNAMFRNLNGQFQNVSTLCGGEDRGFGQGIAVGDLNEDGFDDLLVLNYGPNHVWINNGDGSFSDGSRHWLPDNSVWSTSAAIADIDGDGVSDAFIANYCAGLEPVTEACFAKGIKEPRTCSPNHFFAEADVVLKGAGEGKFVDVTQAWRVTPDVLGRGLGIVAGSFDDNPGIDLFVANDMTTNHFWSRRPDRSANQSFAMEESAALRGLASDGQSRSQGSMGIAVADLNEDKIADFYVTNFEQEYNTLHMSHGAASWTDETSQENLLNATLPMVGFGTQAVDLDNNGECELVVSNGHVDHVPNASGAVFYEQPAQLFQRNSSGTFKSVADILGGSYFHSNHVGRALWTIDANRDGKTDLVVTHQSEHVALLMNQTESRHSYISLRLVGKQDSRNAVGSVVVARSRNINATSFLTSGDGFECSNERCIRFGLGRHDQDVDVTVRWLNGIEQTWSSLKMNQEWLLIQDEEAFSL